METLPAELVVMILPRLGGTDFINIRQTCTRMKDIADDLELSSRPALWRWYVLCDFLRPCVESIAPWLYVEDKNDPFIWKMLYVKLRKISLFKKGHHKFTHLKFDSREVDLTTDVKFFDRFLFILEKPTMVKLVGLDDTMWRWPQALDSEKNLIDRRGVCTRQLYTAPVAEMLERSNALKLVSKGLSSPSELIVQGNIRNAEKFHSFWTHSSLPAFYFDGNEEGCISTWTSCIIFYRRLYMFGESKIFVYNYVTKAPRKICLKTKIYGLKSLVFNEKRIVALCEAQTICVIPNIASEKPVEVFKDKLRTEATKIKMVGDMVIVLFYDGILETSQVVTDENNMVSFTKWHVLMGQNAECFPGYVNAITDFDIQGQLFSAILANGEMFLSHFESLDHDSLERNVHSHFKIPITFDASYLTRMTMDVDGDIKLAVVETLGYAPLAQLHMLYADK